MDGKDLLPIDQIICGDNLEVMRTWPDACVDAIVTDPPYGLSKEPDIAEVLKHWLAGDDYTHASPGFMGKSWDSFVPGPSTWKECFRVLKPGGHLLAFAGTRTQDLMGIAIRLAGFECRDQVCWVFASGFPKSANVGKLLDKHLGAEREVVGVDEKRAALLKNQMGDYVTESGWSAGNRTANITAPATEAAKQWDGWGSALKPAYEPCLMFRKPLDGTIAQNVLTHGVGGINVDGCRIAAPEGLTSGGRPNGNNPCFMSKDNDPRTERSSGHTQGRFPANLILSYPEDSYDADGNLLPNPGKDEVVGLFPETTSGQPCGTRNATTGFSTGITPGAAALTGFGDSGSAARFFKTCEMSAAERLFYTAKAGKADRGGKNNHPTVKPVALMRYLVRLVTPPDGVVLDPFAGSGTTLKAAMLEHFRYIGIEISEEYCEITTSRLRQKQLF